MTVLRQINEGIHQTFEYVPNSTRVDSPIDDALRASKGVCQDFAHVMTTLVRQVGIPCRYVSGYVARDEKSERRGGLASHAWVEALLPGWGWVGFDPTKGKLVGETHVRCAIGRDYVEQLPRQIQNLLFSEFGSGPAKVKFECEALIAPSTDSDLIKRNLNLFSNLSQSNTYKKKGLIKVKMS